MKGRRSSPAITPEFHPGREPGCRVSSDEMEDRIPYVYVAPTTFHIAGEEAQHQPLDNGLLNLHKGQGVLWHDGRRFRVVDSWFSFDKHGHFDMGLHVFLEQVTDQADDLLLRLAPDYFGERED